MAKTDGPSLILDAGPIIHLDQLDALDLVADFDRRLVPERVWREAEAHRPGWDERWDTEWERAAADPGAVAAVGRRAGLHRGGARPSSSPPACQARSC